MNHEEPITFKQFLEDTPPGLAKIVSDLHVYQRHIGGGVSSQLSLPEIELHCEHNSCMGNRVYRPSQDVQCFPGKRGNVFIEYFCGNCAMELKTFAIEYYVEQSDAPMEGPVRVSAGQCYKHGERPAFGPPMPKRLLRMFESERQNMLKGLRCENQGLGIAAFAYYRRVVENKKDALFDRIIQVAQMVGAPQALVDQLSNDKANVQFSNGARTLTGAVPDVLLLSGQNPLTLLHRTLSAGIHGRSDKDCLDDARDVRLILVELVQRMDDALAEKEELKNAIHRLAGKIANKS